MHKETQSDKVAYFMLEFSFKAYKQAKEMRFNCEFMQTGLPLMIISYMINSIFKIL